MMSGAVQSAGQLSRMMRCEAHGLEYPQVLFPKLDGQEQFWTGKCDLCAEDERLQFRARNMAQENKSEVDRRAQTAMDGCEKEIRERTDAEIKSYLEDVRAEVM